MKRMTIVTITLLGAAIGACAPRQGAAEPTRQSAAEPSTAAATARPTTTTAPATSTVTPDPTAPPEITPVPVVTNLFRPGDLIILTQGESELAEIVVDKVKQRTKYDGEYLDDEPAPGNIYIEMFITYRALAENADYGSFDWDVFVDDVAIDGYTYVLNGPEPTLGTGSLPKGRKAEGWLVFEIPKTGRALLSYGANMFSDDPPAFEVLLRNK